MLFVSFKISLYKRNLLVILLMSSGIPRIFCAEHIIEALFQITALGATEKKALGGSFLILFFKGHKII